MRFALRQRVGFQEALFDADGGPGLWMKRTQATYPHGFVRRTVSVYYSKTNQNPWLTYTLTDPEAAFKPYYSYNNGRQQREFVHCRGDTYTMRSASSGVFSSR